MTEKTFDALENAASATECTGLMPALETDHAANEASASLQGIHAAKIEKQRKDATHAKKRGKADPDSIDHRADGDHPFDRRGHDSANARG